MILDTIVKSALIAKIEDFATLVKEDVSFVNTEANKWQVVISFDLDATSMNPLEKEALSALLKYL
jgi:hypothetical protein